MRNRACEKSHPSSKAEQPSNLPPINRHAAEIDIGANQHWVSVPIGRDLESIH
jgi:hypothetical protein